jgi:hypothetical protein
MNDLSIHELRRILGWCFAFTSLLHFLVPLWRIAYRMYRHYTILIPSTLLSVTFFWVAAIIFGVAWWTVWKGRPSAKGWGIAASLTYFLIFFLHSVIFPERSIFGHHVGALIVGTIGMVSFLRHDEQHDPKASPPR